MNRFLNRVLVGKDITQARRRIRWAWIAGFLLAALYLFNAVALFYVWSTGQFAWVVVASGLIAVLSYGVLKRVRMAAVCLFFYFWISQIPLWALDLIPREEPLDVARIIIVQVLPAYLFFQGMRGVLTFHFLTQLPHTTAASPTHESAA